MTIRSIFASGPYAKVTNWLLDRRKEHVESTARRLALRRPMWPAKSLSMKGKSEGFVRQIQLADKADTQALGARIAALLKPGDVVALSGDLGAGKTTLARAMLRFLGVHEEVPSPTFTLVQHYEVDRLNIDHFDLYRIEDEAEVEQLGLDEALQAGAVLIEWPERAGARLPPDTLRIELEIVGAQSRLARVSGPSEWASRLFEGAKHES
ncbi:MAG: tRNA (adenosine(37)-N6)-threonylcarbamoyltransferase complex ATPase subunit type 1 TsaE [Rhizomicrobium sp.]|jgi:tRNA threonylcarbamoyladenosine biosynthesis protein TsaE